MSSIFTFLPVYFLISEYHLYEIVGNTHGTVLFDLMLWSKSLLIVGQVLFIGNIAGAIIEKKTMKAYSSLSQKASSHATRDTGNKYTPSSLYC